MGARGRGARGAANDATRFHSRLGASGHPLRFAKIPFTHGGNQTGHSPRRRCDTRPVGINPNAVKWKSHRRKTTNGVQGLSCGAAHEDVNMNAMVEIANERGPHV